MFARSVIVIAALACMSSMAHACQPANQITCGTSTLCIVKSRPFDWTEHYRTSWADRYSQVPPPGERVLVYTQNSQAQPGPKYTHSFGRFENCRWRFEDTYVDGYFKKVIGWMKLGEPPDPWF